MNRKMVVYQFLFCDINFEPRRIATKRPAKMSDVAHSINGGSHIRIAGPDDLCLHTGYRYIV